MKISNPIVLSNYKGYYIGVLGYEDDGTCLGPYKRLSGYYIEWVFAKMDLDKRSWIPYESIYI